MNRIKHSILILLFFGMGCGLQAQAMEVTPLIYYPKHEINLAYSYGNSLQGLHSPDPNCESAEMRGLSIPVGLSLGYTRLITPHHGLGILLSYNSRNVRQRYACEQFPLSRETFGQVALQYQRLLWESPCGIHLHALGKLSYRGGRQDYISTSPQNGEGYGVGTSTEGLGAGIGLRGQYHLVRRISFTVEGTYSYYFWNRIGGEAQEAYGQSFQVSPSYLQLNFGLSRRW